jgi:hypothetical protein
MFGVEIQYKNGEKDWVDPCNREPVEDGNDIVVSNSSYDYRYKKQDVEKWIKYDLCDICGCDQRDHICED